jgi:hypothetical protein
MLLLALRDEGHLVPRRADHVQLHLVASNGALVGDRAALDRDLEGDLAQS